MLFRSGQGRTRKRCDHDAKRQQSRRDPKSRSVIQKCSSSAPGPQAVPLPPAGNVDAYCNHTMLNSICSFRPCCSQFLPFRQRGLPLDTPVNQPGRNFPFTLYQKFWLSATGLCASGRKIRSNGEPERFGRVSAEVKTELSIQPFCQMHMNHINAQ